MKLKDKVALITGSGSGIGQEIAVAMAREGAAIIINDIGETNINAAIERIREFNVP
jgi:3-oxoacyl-[acyl-carrier protein] reductase